MPTELPVRVLPAIQGNQRRGTTNVNYPNNPKATDFDALEAYGMKISCRWETFLSFGRDILEVTVCEDGDKFAFTDSGVIYL